MLSRSGMLWVMLLICLFSCVTANVAVIISTESRFVLAGNTTSLVATVHANPSPDTAGWYLNNERITPGNRDGTIYSITMNSTTYTLKIQNIQESRLGEYEFVATVGNQTARDSITLTFPVFPHFLQEPPPAAAVHIGDEVSLTCRAYGYPLPTYVWFHNGSRRVRDSRVHLENGTLTISNAQENDRGSYECQAENEAGMIRSQPTVLMVYVLPEPPHFLNVTQTGSSWVQIWWSQSPRAEPAVSGYIVRHCLRFDCNWQYSPEIMFTRYNITRLYPSAHYQVQVMAVSPIGSGEPSSLINVLTDSGEPPSSSTSPSTISTNIGDSVEFHCEVGGSGNLNVEWRRADGLSLPADAVLRGNDLIIAIARVQTSDAGTYICSVRNLAGRAENTTILNVFNRPATTITYKQLSVTSSTPYRLNLTHGDEGPTFVCMSSGYFPPTLTWQKDNGGSPLPNQVNSVIDSSDVQPIHELRWSRSLRYTDSGTYSCTAENDNGTDTATLDLLVQYHPEINTITPIKPVQSDPSASTLTFAIPVSYTGVALTCNGFAWPPPTVQWLKHNRPLSSGISSEQMSRGPGNVSALLKWTRAFVYSDVGQYKCLIRWDNTTVQSTVDIVQGPTAAMPPPSCGVNSTSQECPDNQTIILIAAPVGGFVFAVILVLVIVLCYAHYNYFDKKRRRESLRRAWSNPKMQEQFTLHPKMQDK